LAFWNRGKKAPDGFRLDEGDPLFAEQEAITACLNEWIANPECDTARIHGVDRPAQARMVDALLQRLESPMRRRSEVIFGSYAVYDRYHGFRDSSPAERRKNAAFFLQQLLLPLLRRKLPLGAPALERLIRYRSRADWHMDVPVSWPIALGAVERWAKQNELTSELKKLLEGSLRGNLDWDYHEIKKLRGRIEALLDPDEPSKFAIRSDAAWAKAVLAELPELPEPWIALLQHAGKAHGARPTARWNKEARKRIDALGEGAIDGPLRRWLELAQDDALVLLDKEGDLLRGLVWFAGFLPAMAPLLGDLALFAFKKHPGHGPRSIKVGNACVISLAGIEGLESVAQLERLRQRIRYASAQGGVDAALNAAAERAGLTREDLEEMAVPNFGFDSAGSWDEEFGDAKAHVVLTSSITPEIRWESGGKTRKSIPVAVKRDFPSELKELKAEVRELKGMLPAQRSRIENLLLDARSWDPETWRGRYADHRLLRALARRLIWRLGDRTAGILGDDLVDANDKAVPLEGPVQLWNPIQGGVDEIRAWRAWLERHEITQPFKQAHREIYLLTPAERETRTYSNRFAGHILKQHQLNALAQQRGWETGIAGQWDSENIPSKVLPDGWRAEYWLEPPDFDSDASEMGVFLYLASDQVRFMRGLHGPPAPLEEVPAHIFSEVMRDVDLFVAVASIGADPEWADRGEAGGYGAYWREYSFGELSGSGESRREILAGLLPRLKIADRCELTDRYLVVRGEWNTYRIHLGSGNILMEPGSEYLCIVAGGRGTSAAGKVFLPFEGDHRLSLILSKAFLLADDSKIKDTTILAQIRRRK
jgi:hypothetical protein